MFLLDKNNRKVPRFRVDLVILLFSLCVVYFREQNLICNVNRKFIRLGDFEVSIMSSHQ